MPAIMPLRDRPMDAFLVFWFCLFAVSSLVFEQFIVFGLDLSTTTDVYFGYEFLDEVNRAEANLLAVFLVNIPFTLVPLLLMWRMRRPNPFGPRPIRRQTDPA